MSRTISGTYSSTVTLTSIADNPVTITGKLTGAYGLRAVGGSSQTWNITNSGLISSTEMGIALGGVHSYVGASSIVNTSGHSISAGFIAVDIYSNAPGTITNQVNATISAVSTGVSSDESPETVNNLGVIAGGAHGVLLSLGGTVINGLTGTISAPGGVNIYGGGTVVNSGTIAGSGYAVYLYSAPANRVVTNPGAVFSGSVTGGGGTLELASGASAGTLSVTNFSGFSAIDFDPGSAWKITGGTPALTGTISGLTNLDTIDLTGFVATSDTFASNQLTLTNSGGSHVTLAVAGNFTTGSFQITPDGTGGTNFTACFAAATLIQTPAGAIPVEQLVAGDLVDTHRGTPLPVRWVGRRHIDCTRHPRPEQAWPVRVRAHAFGANLPERDLFLSPNHAVYVNDTLIPIRCLANGASIAQVQVEQIVYYHIELPNHDIVLAEGLPAESYFDHGDRANFENGGDAMRLFPDFAATPDALARAWEMQACAPLIVRGPELEAARALVARAAVIEAAAA